MQDDRHADPTENDLAKLVTGELGTHEFERILRSTEENQQASDELDFLADLVAAIDERNASKLPRRAEHAAGSGRETEAAPGPRFANIARAALLAAGLAALFFGIYWQGRVGSGAAPDYSLGPPRYVHTLMRSETATMARDLARAMEPYGRSAFSDSVTSLRRFLRAHPDHATAHFYLGASLEMLGSANEAKSHYRQAVTGPGLLGEHALWRIAHIHLVEGESERAREILAELQVRGGVFAPNATALLADLESP